MGDKTNISWCDHTHNHWIGCTKVSPACDGCYAEAMMDLRYGRVQWGGPGKGNGTRSLTSEANRKKPLTWNRAAEKAGTRPFVFCSSLADVFDNQVPAEWRLELFELIRATPHLVWLLLTKRPQNIVWMVKQVGFMPSNIAFGTTIEDRTRAQQNLPHLMVAAGLRPLFLFASCEPLLGDLGDLSPWLKGDQHPQQLAEGERFERGFKIDARGWPKLPALGWVITGGETDQGGHKARPTDARWFRSLRDQCAAHAVAYHHKQNGEWVGGEWVDAGDSGYFRPATGGNPIPYRDKPDIEHWFEPENWPDGPGAVRIGKRLTGRLLDGVEHNAFPITTN